MSSLNKIDHFVVLMLDTAHSTIFWGSSIGFGELRRFDRNDQSGSARQSVKV